MTSICSFKLNSLTILLVFCSLATVSFASLRVGFYKSSCPSAEAIVRKSSNKALSQNPGLGAGLIRTFPRCFVRGLMLLWLLKSTPGNPSERNMLANNPSLRVPTSLEDKLRHASRTTGGRVSRDDEVGQNLPPFFFNAQQLADNFARKGIASEAGAAPTVALDPTPNRMDNKYYMELKNRGLLTSDQIDEQCFYTEDGGEQCKDARKWAASLPRQWCTWVLSMFLQN
ncbi:hypothetical protein GH714_024290 [Hevea brasiliensis]|uniref:peroxidase n=1 Tax=Hevea brasiliensis TaxID=3981 RepID=A0A6A6LLP4_HEVBR|nr:hypothetical protein GH714_024290 [Hevea brasiliensis]